MADNDPLLPSLSARPSGAEQWQQAIAQQQQRDLAAPSTGEEIGNIINRLLWGTPIGGTRKLYEDISAGRLDPLSPEAAGRSLWTVMGLSSFLRPPTFEGGMPREMALPEEWQPTPIDPLKEAQWNDQLRRVGRWQDAMRHAWDVENKASPEAFEDYLDHLGRFGPEGPYATERPPTPAAELLAGARSNDLQRNRAPATPVGDPGSLSGLARAMQVPSRFAQPEARRRLILDKLMANQDFDPILGNAGVRFRSLDAAENEVINNIGWSRAPGVTLEQETAKGPEKAKAWESNIHFWRRLADPYAE